MRNYLLVGILALALPVASQTEAPLTMFQDNPRYYPDGGHTVAYNAEQVSPGILRMTPKTALDPGEYGLYFSSDFTSKYRGTDSAIYDFAVVHAAPTTP